MSPVLPPTIAWPFFSSRKDMVRGCRADYFFQINALLREMKAAPCNRGQAAYVELSRAELEKLFERRLGAMGRFRSRLDF